MPVQPTPAQIRAQVAAIVRRDAATPVVGIRARLDWPRDQPLRVSDREFDVRQCDTVLALRVQLVDSKSSGRPLVVLTELPEAELGADVLSRLAKGRLHTINPWGLVRDRFGARWVENSLIQHHGWVAEVLLELLAAETPPPVPGAFLDAERVWCLLFERLLGLPEGRRDLETVLEWSATKGNVGRFERLPADRQRALVDAVRSSAGDGVAMLFEGIAIGRGVDLLPLGLASRLLFGEDTGADASVQRSRGRLEGLLGGVRLDETAAKRWADAAERVVLRRLGEGGVGGIRPWLDRGDAIVEELQAGSNAGRGAVLPSGLKHRLRACAEAVEAALSSPGNIDWARHDSLVEDVRRHALAEHERVRVEGAIMALRLARWLAMRRGLTGGPASLSEAAHLYLLEGGHVDWARLHVLSVDPDPQVSATHRRLLEAVGEARERENKTFAALLSAWTKSGSSDASVIPIETVLQRVVAPLAAERAVLLLVIDGMSVGVLRELLGSLQDLGWTEWVNGEGLGRMPVIAVLPTVTEVSRASLLCGTLTAGTADTEKAGFASHPALVAASRRNKPPRAFHKLDLEEPGRIGVRHATLEAIRDSHARAIAVVVNAVDDHLAKGDQLRLDWSVEIVRPLRDILEAAKDGERVIVVTSDHGHVIEQGSTLDMRGEDARWRPDVGSPTERELRVTGPRVLAGGAHSMIAPWSERVRYTMTKHGYHGGLTPQEVVVPLVVLGIGEDLPPGWHEAAPVVPEWWLTAGDAVSAVGGQVPLRSAEPRVPELAGGQGHLFTAAASATTSTVPPETTPAWVDALLASPEFAEQEARAGRTAVERARVARVLAALDQRGGKLTRVALARVLDLPALRVDGIVVALRRMLNVDGYDVLSIEPDSQSVVLNRHLLEVQFGIGERPA